MASKGVVRTGEAFCLSCHQQVDKDATKCPGCLSELTGEVKAFRCPKCQQIVALGEPQCSKCGLKFKVKTLKPKETAQDDQFLAKLIEWGKPGEGPPAEGQAPPVRVPVTTVYPTPERPNHYDRHIRYHVALHLKHVIKKLDGFLAGEEIGGLVIGGSEEAVVMVREMLPAAVSAKIVGAFHAGMSAKTEEVLAKAETVIQAHEKEKKDALVERLITQARKKEQAVLAWRTS